VFGNVREFCSAQRVFTPIVSSYEALLGLGTQPPQGHLWNLLKVVQESVG